MYILFTRWDESKDEEVYAEFGPFYSVCITHTTIEAYNSVEEITIKIAEGVPDEVGVVWWHLKTDPVNRWGECWVEDMPQNNLCGGVVH